jgi:hypothetical protein
VKWKRPFYGLPDLGWIIEIVAYEVSVNVVFFGGADLASPPPLGDTDRSRYVKIRTLEEAQAAEMTAWIEEVARVPGLEIGVTGPRLPRCRGVRRRGLGSRR